MFVSLSVCQLVISALAIHRYVCMYYYPVVFFMSNSASTDRTYNNIVNATVNFTISELLLRTRYCIPRDFGRANSASKTCFGQLTCQFSKVNGGHRVTDVTQMTLARQLVSSCMSTCKITINKP